MSMEGKYNVERNMTVRPLRWRIGIDWSGQGTWDAKGSDVSADVLGLRWQWGRRGLPTPEFAPPAELTLTLRNHDHRYTPGNASGPLGAAVRPGQEVWLRVNLLHDDFASDLGASGDLDGRIALTGNSPWQTVAVARNGFAVKNGSVAGQGGGWPPSDAVATLDAGDPLATLTARFRRGSNGMGGFVLRCAARDDCLRLRFASAATILERVSGRKATKLVDGAPLAVGKSYDLEIEQETGSVRVFAIELGAVGARWREILTATDITGAPESGRHGLWHGFRNAQDRWSDFGVGRTLFTGRIVSIDPDLEAGVCRVVAADALRRLETIPLRRALAGGPMRSGNVAAAILGWAGFAPGDYALDNGRPLLTGGPRSVWDVSAGRALRRLQREEHGLIYADGMGRVRLEAASRRASARGNPNPRSLARFSIGGAAAARGAHASALRRDDGTDAVEESITFRYRRSSNAGRQQVWSLNEALEVPAGGEQLLLVAPDAWDVIEGLVAPVANTDYAATADAGGQGTDVTAGVKVTLLTEAKSGVAGRGQALKVRNDGAETAYLQRLDLYAERCWRAESSSAAHATSAADSAASVRTGRLIRCRYADHFAAAHGAATARLAERSRPHPQLEITLPLTTAANRQAVVESQLSDVAQAQFTAQGINGAWFLEGMEINAAGAGEDTARCWLTAV